VAPTNFAAFWALTRRFSNCYDSSTRGIAVMPFRCAARLVRNREHLPICARSRADCMPTGMPIGGESARDGQWPAVPRTLKRARVAQHEQLALP